STSRGHLDTWMCGSTARPEVTQTFRESGQQALRCRCRAARKATAAQALHRLSLGTFVEWLTGSRTQLLEQVGPARKWTCESAVQPWTPADTGSRRACPCFPHRHREHTSANPERTNTM